MTARVKQFLMFLTAFASTSVFPALYALRYGASAALTATPGDAFYYLTITRRSIGFRGYTFDGSLPTNGFHPLWQMTLSALASLHILSFTEPSRTVLQLFWISLVVTALAAATFTLFCRRILPHSFVCLLAVSPGLLWLATAISAPDHLSTWSYINGMEGSLAWLMFSLAGLALTSATLNTQRLTLAGVLLGLGVLSRLDDVFIVLALAVLLNRSGRLEKRKMVALLLPPLFLILIYMTWNWVEVGSALPLSGRLKAGLGIVYSAKGIGRFLLPVFTGDAPFHSDSIQREISVRILQMVLPGIICGIEAWHCRKQHEWPLVIKNGLCAGVAMKAAYNFTFVPLFNQGVWYYTFSVAVANLVLCRWLLSCVRFRSQARLGTGPMAALYVLFVTVTFSMWNAHVKADQSAPTLAMLEDHQQVANKTREFTHGPVVDLSDGEFSFATNIPSFSGFGLALDKAGVDALRAGTFFPLMQARGANYLVASMGYQSSVDTYLQSQGWRSGGSLFFIRAAEFSRFHLEIAYRDDARSFVIYRIVSNL